MYTKKKAKSLQRLGFYFLLSLIFFGLTSCSQKEQKQTYKVGILCGLDYITELFDGFKSKMNELGYIDGENIMYDYQRTNFEPVKEKEILTQFINSKSDLILTFPTEVSMAAKAATRETDVPVIFAIANIEGTNLIDSITKPGKNITGVRFPGPDLAIKRFEVMREVAPHAKRMWVPYQRGYPIVANQMEVLRPVAEAEGISLIEFPADDAAELQAKLDARDNLDDIGFDSIFFIPEPISCTDDAFEVMAKFAYKHKMPIGGILMQVGDYGSIFGINVDVPKTGQQAAILADKILKGTPAGAIPVVSSESYLEINYNVAQELGIHVPDGLLNRADRIIR
ncbi:ABC transporter substrate-binding protein [candidate division KSB1 bacterium]|nr:ABC transporter substrate-binding protein [candidate division KSB1 bacterium]